MAFGLIHYVYLVEALFMSACVLLLVRRYLLQKNRMTLVFTVFTVSYVLVGFLYFGRGFFDLLTDQSIVTYRAGMSVTALTPAILALFMFYPMIAERKGAAARNVVLLLLAFWVLALLSVSLLLTGTVAPSFSFENFDVYSTAFGPISYMVILAMPISIALVDALAIIMMYLRENESFYKMRALSLLVGWLLVLVAQIMLLGPATLMLSPLLSTVGVLLMAATILRRTPTT